MSDLHVCRSAKKDCYAPSLSYGEICVGCGCCQAPGPKRDKARLAHWEGAWRANEAFDNWFPEWREVQERNQRANRRYIGVRLRYYRAKVQRAAKGGE